MNTRETLKKALDDPKLEIDVLDSSNYEDALSKISNLPEGSCITEWKHTMGCVEYEYHIHINGVAKDVTDLYAKGFRGGHPRLVDLYSKQKLEMLIQETPRA